MKRLSFILAILLAFAVSCGHSDVKCGTRTDSSSDGKIPVIVITDLYFPGQDIGDNFDLVTPFSLPEIDLKAIVLDVTDDKRNYGENGTLLRDPGYIPATQLNYIFDRNVPVACAPFGRMKSPEDTMEDSPAFQQEGIDLLFNIIENSDRPVTIVSTGSLRPLAVAYNRRPELMCSDRVAAIHISAGNVTEGGLEWNIDLDSFGAARVFRSPMKMFVYPGAAGIGCWDLDHHNTFWALHDLDWILSMPELLRNYLVYNLLSIQDRPDFLGYLEKPLPQEDIEGLKARRQDRWYGPGGRHYVWETAVWQQVAGLVLVEHADGHAELVPAGGVTATDKVCKEEMWPVKMVVKDNGYYSFSRTDEPTNIHVYYREDPVLQERLLNEALPALYLSFRY